MRIEHESILQYIALACVNIIAFAYDGDYMKLAIGLDCAILGYNFYAVRTTRLIQKR
jgi:hypothetical protein